MPKTTLLRKQVTPVGSIQPHAGATAPDGFLVCDGSIVTIADYPNLYAAIGTNWGYGNNDGLTFHLPDLRGRTLRGQDAGAGRDTDAGSRTASNSGGATGDNIGSVQGDATRNPGLQYVDTYFYSVQNRYVAPSTLTNVTRTLSRGVDNTSGWIYGGSGSGPPADNRYRNLASTQNVSGGNSETRQKNANVNYVIKAV
jgi:hypothetical protein